MAKQANLQKPSAYPLAVSPNSGSILIIALWSLCLLAVFAVYLGEGVRQKITLVKRLEQRDKLHFIAESGVKKAITVLQKELKESEDSSCKTLNDNWSNNTKVFEGIKVDDGSFNVCYNYMDEVSGLLGTRYGLIDEERKININKIDRPALERLFRVVLNADEIEAQELAASIIDWRDEDSELSIPLGSGEDSFYRGLKYSYEAKDAEFEVLKEVLLVKGVTTDIFEKIKDYITIYGNGKVNINTASKEVLLALGLPDGLVGKILLFRQGEDGLTSTDDDSAFEVNSTIIPELSQHSRLSDAEVALLSVIRDKYLTTDSHHFMIRSVAGLDNKKGASQTIAVVDQNGKILYWQE